MTYEFSLDKSQYSGCSGVTIALVAFDGEQGPVGGMHNSPAKEGGENIITTPTNTNQHADVCVAGAGTDSGAYYDPRCRQTFPTWAEGTTRDEAI